MKEVIYSKEGRREVFSAYSTLRKKGNEKRNVNPGSRNPEKRSKFLFFIIHTEKITTLLLKEFHKANAHLNRRMSFFTRVQGSKNSAK